MLRQRYYTASSTYIPDRGVIRQRCPGKRNATAFPPTAAPRYEVVHFEKRQEALRGKAMIVCMSRRICMELYRAITALRPTWHSADDAAGAINVVMTGSAADPPDWQDYIRNKARGEALHLMEDELAFYDALEVNDSAVKVLGDETLKTIARELVEMVRRNVTIDWTAKEGVRAKLRVMVKRILRRYGYPPDKQDQATRTVLEQAELIARDWAEVGA